MIRIKRVYEPAEAGDGYRVLVDRVWPRGISKPQAAVRLWLKDAAPSTALRKWFAHDPARWAAFRRRYRMELRRNPAPLERLKQLHRQHGTLTLVFSARDERRNQAVVLRELLRGRR